MGFDAIWPSILSDDSCVPVANPRRPWGPGFSFSLKRHPNHCQATRPIQISLSSPTQTPPPPYPTSQPATTTVLPRTSRDPGARSTPPPSILHEHSSSLGICFTLANNCPWPLFPHPPVQAFFYPLSTISQCGSSPGVSPQSPRQQRRRDTQRGPRWLWGMWFCDDVECGE